jgi:PAS domain S-box-containing protein
VASNMRKLITEDIKGFLKGKHPEQALQEALRYVQSIIETMRDPLVVLDNSLRVISANQSFYEIFLVRPEDAEGSLIYELGDGQWDIPKLRELLEEILPKNTSFNDFEIDHDFPGIGRRVMLLNARRVYSEGHKTQRILLGIEDITERKHMEQEVAASEFRYRRLFETARDGILILDAETAQIEDVNPFLVDMLGFPQCVPRQRLRHN